MKYKRNIIIALACVIALSGAFLAVSYLGRRYQSADSGKAATESAMKKNEETPNNSNAKPEEEKENKTEDENKKKETSDKVKEGYYIVKSNDTLYSIARTYMPSYTTAEVVKGIRERNNIEENQAIIPGQKIIISYETALETKNKEKDSEEVAANATTHNNHVKYVVKDGDTLYSIATKYFKDKDISEAVKTIKEHNNLTTDVIKIDETLCIPVEQ